MNEPAPGAAPAGCPDENVLNAFVEGRLGHTADDARRQVEEHLDTCSECLEVVSHMARVLARNAVPGGVPASDEVAAEGPLDGEEPPPLHDLRAGDAVGRYRVEEMLGQGGMGVVYRARDTQLGRDVALKLLREGRGTDGSRERLVREARLMAKLDHRHLVTVFDAGEADGRTYIAMELVVGSTLAGWLRTEARAPAEIVEKFLVAGRALAAAHATGVVHRDFKPENVLLDRSGRLAVTDFGIATSRAALPGPSGERAEGALAPAGIAPVTATGQVLGTPGYMSPEQHTGEHVGPTSDQFSFAVALFEALFGVSAFEGDTVLARRAALLEGRTRPLSPLLRSRVSGRVRRALLRALSRDPSGRFPSMVHLCEALERGRAVRTRQSAARRWVLGAAAMAIGGALLFAASGGRSSARGRGVDVGRAAGGEEVDAARSEAVSFEHAVVVTFPFVNETGDARLDDVVGQALAVTLSSSRRLTAYTRVSFSGSAPGQGAAGGDAAVERALLTKENRPVIAVHGTVIPEEGTGFTISLVARDVGSGRTVAELRETRASSELVPALAHLSTQLRAALGDAGDASDGPHGSNDGSPVLSSSLDALHEWATGLALLQQSRSVDARDHLGRAVAFDPLFADAHGALAVAYGNVADGPDAVKEDELALEHGERLTERIRLLVRAHLYGERGRTSDAVAVYEQILAIWPGDLTTEINITAAAGDAPDLRLELSRRAATDHPYSVRAQTNLLLNLLRDGDAADAARTGDALLDGLAHMPADAYGCVAAAYELDGEDDRALDVLRRLDAIDRQRADEGRADLALYEGRLDDAEALLRPYVTAKAQRDRDPSSSAVDFQLLALVRSRRGDAAGANVAGQRALSVEERGLQYQAILALLSSGRGSDREALALAAAWSSALPPVPRSYAELVAGDLALRDGRAAAALLHYEAALALADTWSAHQRLADAHRAAKQWSAAENEIRICLARRGEGAAIGSPSVSLLEPVEYALAQVLAEGHQPEARAAYRAFLDRRRNARGDVLVREARAELARLPP